MKRSQVHRITMKDLFDGIQVSRDGLETTLTDALETALSECATSTLGYGKPSTIVLTLEVANIETLKKGEKFEIRSTSVDIGAKLKVNKASGASFPVRLYQDRDNKRLSLEDPTQESFLEKDWQDSTAN